VTFVICKKIAQMLAFASFAVRKQKSQFFFVITKHLFGLETFSYVN